MHSTSFFPKSIFACRDSFQATLLHGFSLIELMVALTVAGFLVGVAVPSFSNMTISSGLTAVANDYVSALNVARMEAVKRNTNVTVCADSTCSVTAMEGRPASLTQVRRGVTGVEAPLQVQNVSPLVYSPQGIAYRSGQTVPYTGVVADVFSKELSLSNHRCVFVEVGVLVSTCTDSSRCAFTNGAPNASCK